MISINITLPIPESIRNDVENGSTIYGGDQYGEQQVKDCYLSTSLTSNILGYIIQQGNFLLTKYICNLCMTPYDIIERKYRPPLGTAAPPQPSLGMCHKGLSICVVVGNIKTWEQISKVLMPNNPEGKTIRWVLFKKIWTKSRRACSHRIFVQIDDPVLLIEISFDSKKDQRLESTFFDLFP